ncbi:MAG: hypothetical protein K2L64_00725, partial [Ureaplasma sp.]|nr:hypothetical protein [Ureaplasma sp.]
TGINTKFNQLFYLIKYPDLLWNKFPNLFEVLEVLYSEDISKIFKFILTSETTQINLFEYNTNNSSLGVLRTAKNISEFYPSLKEKSEINPPNFNDINFVKNELLKFIEIDNEIYLSFLDEDLNYSFSKDNLKKLNSSFPNIRDYESFSIYVDSFLEFKNLQSFLRNLFQIFPKIYKYNLNDNYLNLSSSCVLKPEYSSKVSTPSLFILFYSLLPVLLVLLIRKQVMFIKRKKHD